MDDRPALARAILAAGDLPRPPRRPLTLLAVAGTGVLAAVSLGAVTNAVNGLVCPEFFRHVARRFWPDHFSLWQAAVAQGVLEGLVFGVAFSLLYAAGVGIISRARCRYREAVRPLVWIILGSVGGWVLGGFFGLALVLWNPGWYRALAPDAPLFRGDQFADAWVLGSIWGIEFGGFVSVVLAVVLFAWTWSAGHPARRR